MNLPHNFYSKIIALLTLVYVLPANAQTTLQAFPLTQVRLLNSPFLSAEETDMNYMFKLNPDRLLAPFLREAGLKPKAQSYGNWENSGLDGHTAGHYLTALAQMYASTSDLKWKQRLDYMVTELKRCQDNRNDGYVGGIPGGPEMWAQVKTGDLTLFHKKWVPWYNMHKLYAGLRDAYLIAGNTEAKDILIKLSDWCDQEVAGLTEEQMQKMLATEHGGMNEVLADVAAITGNDKYLKLAIRFSHQAILLPLESQVDKLDGLHANTQIPKIIGFERIAQLDHDKKYDDAARFFWKTVVDNRSISIGGNSVREHFNPAKDFTTMVESEQGPESCNSYNMLKLTKQLFLTKPDAAYMDYYERTLYNHILSTERPGKDGGFVYFTPIRPQHYRVYSQPDEGFWCCVGTGMENHGKYGEMIYAHGSNDIYVNLFIASVLNWKEKGITLTQTNNFPFEERTELQLKLRQPKTFRLYIRKPKWVKNDGFKIMVNGRPVTAVKDSSSYVAISRRWASNDKISISLPMTDRMEQLPDHSSWVSILHGPIVLAAATSKQDLKGLMADDSRLGHIASGPLYPLNNAPLLVDKGESVNDELRPVSNEPLTYRLTDMIYQPEYKDLILKPFFEIHDTRYVLYWPIAKQGEEKQLQNKLGDNDRLLMSLAQRTIDQVSPGEQQSESDHFMDAENSNTGILNNRHWRSATGYFSYKMKMNLAAKILQVTYYGGNKGREFDIYTNGQRLAHVALDGTKGNRFFTVDYTIPEQLRQEKNVTVKFVATNGAATADVFNLLVLK